jgi:hypothetical protein
LTFLHTTLSILKQHGRALAVLGLVVGGLVGFGMSFAAFMPELRVSVSMGYGVFAPKLSGLIGGL